MLWQVMPLLRQILGHASDKTHQMLRAKALECISLVGMAIGRDRFREDAHAVMQYIQSLQVSHHRMLHGVACPSYGMKSEKRIGSSR